MVQLCAGAGGGAGASAAVGSSLAEQLSVQCTDGTAAEDCIPECNAVRHGFILLLNLDGDDTKLSCNLAHGLYSWMGAASEGGYLGADFASFLSAVISGAAGAYIVTLTEDAGIGTDLTIRPGQDVRISADPGLAAAPSWGSGGFTVQERGSLSLTFLAVRGAIGAEQGGASLSLSRCALLPGRDGAADRMLFHDATVRITDTDLGYRGFTSIGGNVVIRSSTTVACTGCLRTLGCVVDTVGASAQSMSGCQPNLIQARDGAHITLAEMEIYPLLLALLKDVSRGQNPGAQNPRVEDTACGNTITFDQVSIIGRPSYGVLTGTLAVGPRGSYDATGQLSITREPPASSTQRRRKVPPRARLSQLGRRVTACALHVGWCAIRSALTSCSPGRDTPASIVWAPAGVPGLRMLAWLFPI